MENFYKKYDFLDQFYGFQLMIDYFINLAKTQNVFFGITGSAISHRYKSGMDVDLVLILPNEYFLNHHTNLPDFLDTRNWEIGCKLINKENINIIGTKSIINPALRVEIYSINTFNNILEQKIFTINRIKEVPKKNKIELFYNRKGLIIEKKLKIKDIYSTTQSFIKYNSSIYWGMHYERLLLSDKIVDTLDLFRTIKTNREYLVNNLERKKDLNKLFFLSTQNKLNISHYFNNNNNDD